MRKNFLTITLMFLASCSLAMAEDVNLITISANGVRTTYTFDAFRSVTLANRSEKPVTFNVNFNDGTQSTSGIRKIVREIVPDEPQEEVEVQTDETSATFTWPPVDGAVTYQLIIYKNYSTGERYCTLTFNSSGQLVSMDFNPAGPSTKAAQSIYSFTVTGLEENKQYQYEMIALGSAEQEIEKTEGSFETGLPTSIDGVTDGVVNLYSRNHTIVVDCETESIITLYDTLGRQIGDHISTQHCECTVTLGGIYIVGVNDKQYKIRIDN